MSMQHNVITRGYDADRRAAVAPRHDAPTPLWSVRSQLRRKPASPAPHNQGRRLRSRVRAREIPSRLWASPWERTAPRSDDAVLALARARRMRAHLDLPVYVPTLTELGLRNLSRRALTPEQDVEVRRIRDHGGVTIRQIAAAYGVSEGSIERSLRRTV
jgi:hypothetical protein